MEQVKMAQAAEQLGLTIVANDYQNNILIVAGYEGSKIIVFCYNEHGFFTHQYEI